MRIPVEKLTLKITQGNEIEITSYLQEWFIFQNNND